MVPTWPELGPNLAPKMAQNPKIWLQIILRVLAESGSINDLAFELRLGPFSPLFWTVLGSIWEGLGSIWGGFAWKFRVTSLASACLRPLSKSPQRLPRTKPRTAENKAENKALPTTTEAVRLHSAVLLNLPPIHKAPDSKNVGRRYSPQGGLQFNTCLLYTSDAADE